MTRLTPAERLVARSIELTWAFYLIGALYIVGPALGWILGAMALVALYFGPALRPDLRPVAPVPPVVWGWAGCVAGMLVALWIGHVDWGLGTKQTIKSTIGWAKGWSLMFLFPLAGAVLPIHRAPIVRAYCVVGAVTLALLPLFLIAPYIGLPQQILVSPLKVVGGPGPEYFTVYLYTLDPGTWAPRWQFFLPWSPFAGLIGVVTVLFAREEACVRWRRIGYAAGLAMILMSKSRMSLAALPICLLLPSAVPLLARTWAWLALAAASSAFAIVGGSILSWVQDGITAFRNARADSTRVRDTLQRIAYDRWWTEARIFGHGVVERGPHLVEYMPIGSHHSWYGLLFVKGLLGAVALAVPLAITFIFLLVKAQSERLARTGLGLTVTLVLYSFAENLEILAYLYWPALVMIGIALKPASEKAGS